MYICGAVCEGGGERSTYLDEGSKVKSSKSNDWEEWDRKIELPRPNVWFLNYIFCFFYLYGNFSVKKVEFLKKDLGKRLITLQCQKKFLCKSHVIRLVAETRKSFFAKVTLFDHSIMSQIFHIFKICIEGAATDRRYFARRKLSRSLVRKKIF